jgi:hypothetical protein
MLAPHDDWQLDGACRAIRRVFFTPNYFEGREAKNEREAKAKLMARRRVSLQLFSNWHG